MILVDEVLHAIKENNFVFKEFDFSENAEEKWLWYYAEERLYLICNEYISPRTGEVTRTYFLEYGTSPLDAFSKIGKVVKNEQ
ncbi:MAG: hypothetical protein K6G85_03900 [Eubacterium sp.]|nr:hypothetical protein [Eubacterium sp.]